MLALRMVVAGRHLLVFHEYRFDHIPVLALNLAALFLICMGSSRLSISLHSELGRLLLERIISTVLLLIQSDVLWVESLLEVVRWLLVGFP